MTLLLATRLVIVSQFLLTTILNLLILFILSRRRLTRFQWLTTVTVAVYGTLLGLVELTTLCLHVFSYGAFAMVLTSPLVTDLPRPSFETLVTFYISYFILNWGLIPSASVMQYMVLTRKRYSLQMQLLAAYSVPAVVMVLTVPVVPFIFVPRDQEDALRNLAEVIFNNAVELDSFRYVGFNLVHETEQMHVHRLIISAGIYAAFTLAYAALMIFGRRVQRMLTSYGVEGLSDRTRAMHRRFMRTQFLQGFLPFVLFLIPIMFGVISTLTGQEFGGASVTLSFAMYSVPILQAVIILLFLAKSVIRPVRISISETVGTNKLPS